MIFKSSNPTKKKEKINKSLRWCSTIWWLAETRHQGARTAQQLMKAG